MKRTLSMLALALCSQALLAQPPLGLPAVPVPQNNPQTAAKIELGEKLFTDKRFSSTGTVSCASCHAPEKAFTDETGPIPVSVGINGLTGTRNAPTVVNAAYNKTQFWDGRSPDLEDQSQHPFVNPVEMGLPNHEPILAVIRDDRTYRRAFNDVFDVDADEITMEHVKMAIASFERTAISGNSPFDRWYYGGEETAISESAKRGFDVFLKQGRCVSCHAMEQDHALFTDHKFHNIGVGINAITDRVPELAGAFLVAKANGADVDVTVLTDPDTSNLGRFAVTEELGDVGGFKTPTLRNIAVTPPYMHDGSITTLRDVVVHYNNGGATNADDPVNPYLSGGIRPLELNDQQIDDLVAFMETLTSPEHASGR
jgi:cytochrome c peroxidase